MVQQTLFPGTQTKKIPINPLNSEWGTFKDSLRAPVYSWFTYPAGFSYKAVQHSIQKERLVPGKSIIYDPFTGSGTTNLAAKQLGMNSVGIEAHPFVLPIAQTKIDWDIDEKKISRFLINLSNRITTRPKSIDGVLSEFPELVKKCYLPEALFDLKIIRDEIGNSKLPRKEARFLRLALICSLREISIAATGWPYIAPKKVKVTSMSKNAFGTFQKRVIKMLSDLELVKLNSASTPSIHKLILGDSGKTAIEGDSVDHIFTSPPYLNNFDYADRTRLEMYFTGDASDWGDITTKVRTKLMTSATTQISRGNSRYILRPEIQEASNEVYEFLSDSTKKLHDLRSIRNGKKSYDLLVSGYFNDIYRIISDNLRVLKAGSKAIYILGDSAPYGIHIPTDELIGKMGVGLGFSKYSIQVLRARGGKWKSNPQRHSVVLRESVVTLTK